MVPLGMLPLLVLGCQTSPARPIPPAATAPAELGVARLSAAQVSAAKLEVQTAGDRVVGRGVRITGRVVLRDLDTAHVFSPVTGRVVRIEAPLGATVKARTPLAIIASADVGQAFSDVEKAGADDAAAAAELRRQRELFEAQAVARKDLEAAQAGAAKARAELDRARHKARLLRSTARDGEAQEYVLRAPIDGEVLARNVSPGVEVQGQYAGGNVVELFTIGNLDPILVEADAFETDLARIRVGAAASVEVAAYPGLTFPATVEWIADALDPQTRTARVRCALPNPDHQLKPEMFATVTITSGGTSRLALPRSALLRLGDQVVAFVETSAPGAGTRVFQRRPVGIDEDDDGEFVPITHGVSRGERVATSGAILLAGMVQ
jgi:cobalt-zinc-cadmium efflux system membrane fusion protein